MSVTVATFNLNNLFSRFNFRAEINSIPQIVDGGITLSFDTEGFKARTFVGRLVKAKDDDETFKIAARIKAMDVDVLAVQEVEHIEILKQFNRDYLDNRYPHVVLVEGNDSRLIDVGVLSKLPIGAIVSHQTATHPAEPEKRIFSRDLLQVEILNQHGTKLFNLYNTHLKSHFVSFGQDPVHGQKLANTRRQRQAETVSAIISRMERSNSKFMLVGDMNDPPESAFLQAMQTVDGIELQNALMNAKETGPPKQETEGQGQGPQTTNWTHRFNQTGEFPRYEQLDQIWLSQALNEKFIDAFIERRTKHTGDGSDHDPAWVVLNI
ncbi:MAG: endonuclease/exonuclease/phosphatase family protein [Methylococcales bacterium]